MLFRSILPRRLAESNAQQVLAAASIAKTLGREIATPGEARRMLGLKGGSQVNY